MDMILIERLFGGVPTAVAEMGNQLVTAGMKGGEKIGNGLSDIIDDIIESIFEQSYGRTQMSTDHHESCQNC